MDDSLYTPIELDILDDAADDELDAIDSLMGLDDSEDYEIHEAIDTISGDCNLDTTVSEFAYK